MPKGLITQGAVVLTEWPLTKDAVENALSAFAKVTHKPAEGEKNWITGYPSWVVPMRLEVNGLVVVDVVDAAWPDDMGDPKQNPFLFAAWSMGMMGPHTWPGNLARAIQNAEAFGQKGPADAAKRHRAIVRVRSSYVLGAAGKDAKVIPADYDAKQELEFVTSVAEALARAPGALCYFNPGGETLHTPDGLDELLDTCAEAGLPPLPVWSANRMVRLDDAPPWFVADTIGMEQLGAQDHEAVFERGKVDPGEVLSFLRTTTVYTLDKGPVIQTGHTIDGPGGIWRALEVEGALMPAPRRVIRWYPDKGPRPPEKLMVSKPADQEPPRSNGGVLAKVKSLFRR